MRFLAKGLLPALFALAFCMGSPASSLPLSEGDQAPQFDFVDIRGIKGKTEDYRSRIIVFTFADRSSNKDLTTWIEPAGLEVARRYPDIKIAYVNFADVSAVPRLLRHVVEPILRRLNERTMKRSREFYANEGIPSEERFAFHLIPDWDGKYIKAFGITDASRYYCWVVAHDRVVARLVQGEPEIERRFLEIFQTLAVSPR
jgi:hypothetical protein